MPHLPPPADGLTDGEPSAGRVGDQPRHVAAEGLPLEILADLDRHRPGGLASASREFVGLRLQCLRIRMVPVTALVELTLGPP